MLGVHLAMNLPQHHSSSYQSQQLRCYRPAQIKGKEVIAACDAKSSRLLEKLIAAADSDAVLTFVEALLSGEQVAEMPAFLAIATA